MSQSNESEAIDSLVEETKLLYSDARSLEKDHNEMQELVFNCVVDCLIYFNIF